MENSPKITRSTIPAAKPPLPAGMVVDTAAMTQQLKQQQLHQQQQAIINGQSQPFVGGVGGGSVASEANESFASGGGLTGMLGGSAVSYTSGGEANNNNNFPQTATTTAAPTTQLKNWLSSVQYRCAQPTDVPTCYDIQIWSYPEDEAATKSSLQYRQHHAAPYFRVAVLHDEDSDTDKVVGFICATRCIEFEQGSMHTHDSSGSVLGIHSVVVRQEYRRQGLASAMLQNYISTIKERDDGVEKVVLLAKSHLLGFYVQSGFTVTKPSDIVLGKELWYELEMDVRLDKTRLKGYPYYVVDGFATTNLQPPQTQSPPLQTQTHQQIMMKTSSGNPAAVVLLPSDFDVSLESTVDYMKVIAREFNLSETAFVWRHPSDVPKKSRKTANSNAMLSDERSIGSSTSLGAAGDVLLVDPTTMATTTTTTGSITTEKDNKATQNQKNKQQYDYNIRFVTGNGTEIDLCGHATLAAASVLFQTLPVKIKNDVCLRFHANRDVLIARPHVEGSKSWIRNGRSMKVTLNFPQKALQDIAEASERKLILSMLKRAFGLVDMAEHVIYIGVAEDQSDLFVHLTNEAFHSISGGGYSRRGISSGHHHLTGTATTDSGQKLINYNALTEFEGYTRGVIICCRATTTEGPSSSSTTTTTTTTATTSLVDGGSGTATTSVSSKSDNNHTNDHHFDPDVPVDFLSRFFAPKIGINEDHVTGSAHCILGPYFSSKTGQDYVCGKQVSKRGGIVECILQEEDRIAIIGTAVTTMSGSLSI